MQVQRVKNDNISKKTYIYWHFCVFLNKRVFSPSVRFVKDLPYYIGREEHFSLLSSEVLLRFEVLLKNNFQFNLQFCYEGFTIPKLRFFII